MKIALVEAAGSRSVDAAVFIRSDSSVNYNLLTYHLADFGIFGIALECLGTEDSTRREIICKEPTDV